MTDEAEDFAGVVVLVLNAHGVAEAFGPFASKSEAHDVADFAAHLVPTWFVNLEDGSLERYASREPETPKRTRPQVPKMTKPANKRAPS